MPRTVRTPSYRLHRPTDQGVVTLNGRDIYLGKYGTPQSRAEYDRVISEWLAAGRGRPPVAEVARPVDLTVDEVIAAFWPYADRHYRHADGTPTGEVENYRYSLRPLRRLYGHTEARRFGPLALKVVREELVASGLCRTEVNKRVGRIVRVFKWAVENELVPSSVHHGLRAVRGLAKGRSQAKEHQPVRPVADEVVEAIRPHVAPQVWAMVELQRLTGMRPGEVVIMRTIDLSMTGSVWEYRPHSHKTAHHGKERVVYLGPRAQEVLRPWLRTELTGFLFSPREAVEQRVAARESARSVRGSRRGGTGAPGRAPGRAPGERYMPRTYHHAIRYGCDRAFPHPELARIPRRKLTPEQRRELATWRREHAWHPHQLRHAMATRVRRLYDVESAQTVLGHEKVSTAEIYAEKNMARAREVMRQIG